MKQQPMCDDKSLLMAYLYGECDTAERRLVEQHLAGCATCAAELAALRSVRGALREWAPPEEALGFRIVRGKAGVPERAFRIPAWAQLAAAVLILAVGAAIANLDVRVGSGGLTIRTGWQRTPAAPQVQPQASAPWRAELVAFERQMREEMSALRAAAPTTRAADTTVAARASTTERAALPRYVQAAVDDMARRQQRDVDQQIAERFLRLAHDFDSQRMADQRRFLQGLSQIDQRTAQLSQVQNYLLRNANVQEIK